MHKAQIEAWAEAPRYIAVDELPAPTADQLQLRVLATGLHAVVRGRASGIHYSAKSLPHVPGIDFVGRDEATGQVYYGASFADTFGTFAERVNVPKAILAPVPDGVDPAAFAGSVNPAMSGWMALTARTENLPKDFTVLIIGATSASGRLAVHAAKSLGAGKVIGAARGAEALKGVAGLDDVVVFQDPITETDFSHVEPDVILDYVYGDVTAHMLATLRTQKPLQYVQIGTLSQQMDIPLGAALLRSTNLTLRGTGPGAWTFPQLAAELPKLLKALAQWPLLAVTEVALKDIEKAWGDKSTKGRIVVVP